MNPLALLASAGTVLGYIEDAVKYGPAVLAFIHSAVAAVESTGKSGPDKMTAVLNAVGTFAEAILPNEAAQIEAFMHAVETMVSELVAVYNMAGIFIHGPAKSV